ncbi:hypothetical protein Q3G72_029245 [Acer saccharum]|nr:hypothetical protein Q3G72_029245 [Acer saccharum]
MGSAALNKPPSPFITFVHCFLLISFLFYIPHRIVAQRVKNGASSVHGSPLGHAPNAVGQGSPKQSSPTQNHPTTVAGRAAESCSRSSAIYNRGCVSAVRGDRGHGESPVNPGRERSTESGESMYNWMEGVTPGRH